jgi:hypothetical protein
MVRLDDSRNNRSKWLNGESYTNPERLDRHRRSSRGWFNRTT